MMICASEILKLTWNTKYLIFLYKNHKLFHYEALWCFQKPKGSEEPLSSSSSSSSVISADLICLSIYALRTDKLYFFLWS